MAQREFARASIDVIQETGKRNISACERCVGALGKLNAFWQGESPCRVRSSQPPLPSVAAMKEVGLMTVWRTGENSWCWDMFKRRHQARLMAGVML